MSGLSRLLEKCKTCPHAENCDKKRMEACGYISINPNITAPMTMPIAAPVLRDTSASAMAREEIAEQINKEIYKHLNCKFASGN